eukprot:COSAG01_NODE_4770_length_4754_cov_5.256713_8_plen_217_part_00
MPVSPCGFVSDPGVRYKALEQGVAKATGRPARLHPELSPPGFLIWLPHVGWRVAPEIHTDADLSALLGELVLPEDMHADLQSDQCDWKKQSTLTLTLSKPDPRYRSGIDMWSFDGACDAGGAEDDDGVACIAYNYTEYHEAGLVIFPSNRNHAAGHGQYPMFGTLSSARIIVVAFVVPCRKSSESRDDGADRDDGVIFHILPTYPLSLRGRDRTSD